MAFIRNYYMTWHFVVIGLENETENGKTELWVDKVKKIS